MLGIYVATECRYNMINYQWDEAKRRRNLLKHHIDFLGCEAVFEGYTLTMEDDRFGYGERRFITLGLLNGRVVAIAHTETEYVIRIISIRKATRREQQFYFESLGD